MEAHEVVPDVVDSVPPNLVQLKYPSGVEVKQGNELTPTQVKDQPQVHFAADGDALYTLIMSDPDAPSRSNPEVREFLHWLVVDIPGSDIRRGTTVAEFFGSGPPKDSGLHRYVFFIFKQPGKINCTELGHYRTSITNRRNFKTRDFAKKYNLGKAIAGNFYQAQYDDYVPILHAQLKK